MISRKVSVAVSVIIVVLMTFTSCNVEIAKETQANAVRLISLINYLRFFELERDFSAGIIGEFFNGF